MKKTILTIICTVFVSSIFAQTYTETFDSNSLGWTEVPFANKIGTGIIENGSLTIKSYTKRNFNWATGERTVTNTFFESHCYAPLDVEKPFTITSNVVVKRGEEYGIAFNYRDDGNLYVFCTDGKDMVSFERYENNECVGSISQGIKWKKGLGKKEQTWTIKSNGSTLEFIVNDEPLLTVRYMPLQYTGFGYYSVGQCEISIDKVTFTQDK